MVGQQDGSQPHAERDHGDGEQCDGENPARNLGPVQGEEDGQRGHAGQQITFVALVGQGEDGEDGDDPDPEKFFLIAQFAPPQPSDDEERDESGCEESGVERVRNNIPPDAGFAPEEVEEVVASAGIELADIFLEHEVLQDEVPLRIEPIPEAEDTEGDEGHRGDLRNFAAEPRAQSVAVLMKSPPRQAGGRGQDEGEGFVKESGADEEAEGEGGGPAKFIALPLA